MASITVDNTWAKLEGTPAEVQVVREALTYKVEGYQFMAAYKAHRWDGRRTLFTADQRFPAGLAFPMIKLLGVGSVTDLRERAVPSIEWGPLRLPNGGQLQDHQEMAVRRIVQATRGVVEHAVGAGKSVVIIESVRRTQIPSLIIVPTKDLLYQMHDDLSRFIGTKARRIGMIGDGVWQPQDVTVATVQTITRSISAARGRQGGIDLAGMDKRRRMLETLARFQGIHVDECHHVPSESYSTLMANLPGAYIRIGYSATPMRGGSAEQTLLVTGLLGPVISQHVQTDNIEAGRAVPTDIFMIEAGGAPVDDGEVRVGRRVSRDYATSVKSGIIGHVERNRKITKLAEVFGAKGPTIVLTERLEHGRILAAALAERGHEEVN